jgi:hypothetical protein
MSDTKDTELKLIMTETDYTDFNVFRFYIDIHGKRRLIFQSDDQLQDETSAVVEFADVLGEAMNLAVKLRS